MTDQPTNLRVFKRSRKNPEAGDVFVVLPPDAQYVFGRLIRTDALGPIQALLVYLYSRRSSTKAIPDNLNPHSLLIPPVITNALGGNTGASRRSRMFRCEPRTCWSGTASTRQAATTTMTGVRSPRPPSLGIGGVTSYRMIDDRISDALGVARV